jgi:hypothetical protein
MKKQILLSAIFMLFLSSSSLAQDKSIGDGGFYLSIGGFKPNYNFFVPKAMDVKKSDMKEYRLPLGPHLELGNLFKLTNFEDHALHLKVSWLDGNYSAKKVQYTETGLYDYDINQYYGPNNITDVDLTHNIADTTITRTATSHLILASSLKIGPNFTYVLNDNMAIDVYYQFSAVYAYLNEDDTDFSGLGKMSSFGINYRFMMFTAGFDFIFGSIKDMELKQDEIDLLEMKKADYLQRINSFRFYVGFKF